MERKEEGLFSSINSIQENMKKVSEKELKEVRANVSVYHVCFICGLQYSGWSLFGVVGYWVAYGKAKDCMYLHYDNIKKYGDRLHLLL